MKKLLIALAILGPAACSTQAPQQDNGIYDMKTVQAYRAQVMSGNTVTTAQKERAAQETEDPIKMNASDNATKVKYQRAPVAVVPSIGVGYYRGYHHWY